jgi:aerobic carbon-monoxide dehydrogenase large subunit
VGRTIRRREDPRLLRGDGQYLADLTLPNMLHLAFVRSPHSHALVVRIDAAAARTLSGVCAIFTAADLPMRPILAEFDGEGYNGAAWPPLARQRVRFVGDPVAVVVASDRYLAEDAAALIEVEYHPLPAVASLEAALAKAAPVLHEGVPGNVFFMREHLAGQVDNLFARAPVVVHGSFRHQRLAGMSVEGRGVASAWDAGQERLTLWTSTQTPHTVRTAVARFLELPESAIRVIVPHVGGGFGPKMHVYPEEVVAGAAARVLGRPLKWIEDRRENLLTMTQAREARVDTSLAAGDDGSILAMRTEIACDTGAYPVFPTTAAVEPLGIAQIMPGPYRIAAYAYRALSVATNKAPAGAYRGVGMTTGVYVMERMMDRLARATGLDPAEIRRRNFIRKDEFPFTSATGLVYDSSRYDETLRAVISAFNYHRVRRAQTRMRAKARLVGVGLSVFAEYTGMGSRTFQRRGMREIRGDDSATVAVDSDCRVRVSLSCPSQGQGHETVFAQLVAGELGLDPQLVTVQQTDTDTVPAGSGTFASRAVVSGGGAAIRAATRVRERAETIAAGMMEAADRDVVFQNGRFVVRGASHRAVTWADVARAAAGSGLRATATYDPPPAAFSNGAHAAMVEVDADTGQVKILRYVIAEDCGPLINPMIAEGQSHGGFAQGLGEALLEQVLCDSEGQPLTATLMDYLVPTAMEMPAVRIVHIETPSPYTIGGFKGMGESATIGSPACLTNAVSDALGVDVDAMPMTPELVKMLALRAASHKHKPVDAV